MSTLNKTTWLLLCGALVLIACEESSSPSTRKPDAATDDEPDAGAEVEREDSGTTSERDAAPPDQDGGDPTAPSDCFTDPTTYLEIINACTDAEKVEKTPALPLLLADGGLPDLP